MPDSKAKQSESQPQADKFRELARELECDEDEAAFEEQVRKVAVPPEKETVPKDGPKSE